MNEQETTETITKEPEGETAEDTGAEKEAPTETAKAVPVKTSFDLLMAACQDNVEEGKKKFRIQAVNEQDANFFTRLVEKALTVPQPIFDALPEDAQLWACDVGTEMQAAAENKTEMPAITAPPGFVSRFQAKEGAEAKPPKEKKVKAVKEPVPPKEKKERLPDENSMGTIIKRALINDLSTNADTLRSLLENAGHKDVKASSISTYRTDTLATLRLVIDMGKFKPHSAT